MAAGEMPPTNRRRGLSGSLLPVNAKAFDQMPDDTALQLPAMGGIADAGHQSVRFARDGGGALVEIAAG
ncbi:hypothetical protein [Acidovorax sp. SUPP2539]|uniref:hypothetical protein n=1 Tax=Acidovorax sp. SUPP2539 TaxID=2920878 RepID=UPI0023DE6958|nr:hypothetical protein [Acidovorax sp. SUPP2539]GKS88709.1 hypothetical protein AVTE2539_05110 [Acidovorax sp. SUPP2539]